MRSFAPILWLATDEPTLPMLPHALAFDGVSNFGGAEKDFDSLKELQWDIESSFEDTVKVIDEQTKHSRLPARVLYKAPAIPPTWTREERGRHIYALEYWFCYPYDRGIGGGHKGDSEHVFVFVAIDQPLEHYTDLLAGDAIAIVGAGHESHTANNVLVTGRNDQPRREIFPSELPRHMPVLVELGKHASAPDRNFNGRFDVGADVNVFRNGAWGSRDVQQNSVFRIIGGFEGWYSLPRDDKDIWVESEFDHRAYYDAYVTSYPSRFPDVASASDYPKRYTLFPRQDLGCLYRLLGGDVDVDASCAGSVEEFLSKHKDCFWLKNAPTSISLSEDALATLRRWPKPGEWEGPAQHVKLFKHHDADDPNNIFKLHLYPTVSVGLGAGWDGLENALAQGSVRISEITWAGTQWFPNSGFELDVNFDTRHWQFYDVSAYYLFFRGSYTGFFAGGHARRERLDSTTDLSMGEALDAVTRLGTELPYRAPLSRWRFGLDAGWALTFNFHDNLFFDTKIGLRADLFQAAPSDLEIVLGAQNRFRLTVSVGFRRGVAFPLNPLAY